MTNKQVIQDLIGKNYTDKAITEMKKLFPQLSVEITTIETKYKTVNSANLMGTISFQEYMQALSQVNYGLLNLLNSAEPDEPVEDKKNSQKKYNFRNIYTLLNQAFNDEELTRFCMFNFDDVYNNFAAGNTKAQKITALIDFCNRKLKTDLLLDLVKDENPDQFLANKPYFDNETNNK